LGLRLEHLAQAVPQPVENPTDGLHARDILARAVLTPQFVTNGLGRHARKSQPGLKLGIGLTVGLGQTPNVLGEPGRFVFRPASSPRVNRIQATNPGTQFVEARLDGAPSPPKHGLGMSSTATTVLHRHLRLKSPPSKPRQQSRRRLNRPNHAFRELFLHGLILETSNRQITLPPSLSHHPISLVDHFLAAA
jgi:hypothetical protein